MQDIYPEIIISALYLNHITTKTKEFQCKMEIPRRFLVSAPAAFPLDEPARAWYDGSISDMGMIRPFGQRHD